MPSPVDITPEQLAAFESGRLPEFCGRVRDHLAAQPATFVAHRLPLSWFEERVRRAAADEITIEADVAAYLAIILRAGDDILDHPAIAATLARRDVAAAERVRLAEAQVRRIVNG